MTAAVHRHAAAFLRRTGLVAAVLAIIAGIFGMHVLTGTHAMHSPTSATPAADAHTTAVSPDHAGHPAQPGMVSGHASAEQDLAGVTVEPCSESGDCTSMQAMTVACTPSAKTASMAAPPPGTNVLEISNNAAAAAAVTSQWSYLPGSPSPCELSISRT
ncbi:hypothetical protein [Arthrobacter sp. QXT-31]|uniref:hypothetical protein n=1 Tax=Arthrobacter sp. QXT-31 TaxID=1357915 RepID=UPI00097193BF|nr:hypothetical protein [Arthrobacter sp. QXT-31]APX03575.1 hypothetical protein BWQ92_19275 [Arthrobacter sp. QXT-31]